MIDQYRTIAAPTEGLFRERGSRFISFALPVENEDEIKGAIDRLKKEYHDARHHCYAWRLGAGDDRYRLNDDGEPTGTAGRPVFGQIRQRELSDVLVVVVRYFGGTLLGVSGLIEAYRRSAADALDRADIVEKRMLELLSLEFGYNVLNAVMKVVKDFDLSFDRKRFDMDCSLSLHVWKRNLPAVKKRLSGIPGCTFTEIRDSNNML